MVKIVGHRGARGVWPENTLEGFRRTIAAGVRSIELDVGVLKDGTVVVHHDFALNPDIARLGGRWLAGSLPLLRSFPFDELEDFDVGRTRPGSETAARFPDQTAIDGERIPTLAAVLALDPALEWIIELKLQPDRPDWTVGAEEMVERVLAVVDAAGAGEGVVLESFDWRAPRHARRLRPNLRVAWLTRAETAAQPELWWGRGSAGSVPEAVAAEDGGVWAPFHAEVTAPLVAEARRLGVEVLPWTVNDRADMERLAGYGVAGIITDYPDRATGL